MGHLNAGVNALGRTTNHYHNYIHVLYDLSVGNGCDMLNEKVNFFNYTHFVKYLFLKNNLNYYCLNIQILDS